MELLMQETEDSASLGVFGGSVALVGSAVDERGIEAQKLIRSVGVATEELTYDSRTFEVSQGAQRILADDIDQLLVAHAGGEIILEATTLGLPEIALAIRAALAASIKKIWILYVEPDSYLQPNRRAILHRRDFELTDGFPGFLPIPGFVINLAGPRPMKGVFFVGYEGRRLDRALEDHQMIDPNRCAIVFGVPGFKPGWEMNAFARNVRVLQEKKARPEVFFAGAENPLAAFGILEAIRASLADGDGMFVAPLGTKPSGIGAAIFCAANSTVGLLYDHPIRKAKRTEKVGHWHLYELRL